MTYAEFLPKLKEELDNINSFAGRKKFADQYLGKPIGSGSGRVVYNIDDEKVLKLAKNPKGVAQNEVEAGIGYYPDTHHIVTEVFESSDDDFWLVSQKAKKVNERRIKQLTGIPSLMDLYVYVKNFVDRNNGRRPIYGQKPEIAVLLDENEFAQDLTEFVMNYSQSAGDYNRVSSYGEVLHDGIPSIVLTDYGLNDEVYDTHYSPQRKQPYRVYELYDFADGNDDILSDIGNTGEVRHGMWGLVPYDVGDGDAVINEGFLTFVMNRDKYPDKNLQSDPYLLDMFHECVNNLKENLKHVDDKRKFYNNLLKLQEHLQSGNLYNRDILAAEEYFINENDNIPNVKYFTLNDKNYATKLAEMVAEKLNLGKIGYLGEGDNGYAFEVDNNTVLKITSDIVEADASIRLLRAKPQFLVNIYNIYKIVDTENNLAFFAILQENIIDKPKEKFRRYFEVVNILKPNDMDIGDFFSIIRKPESFDYNGALEKIKPVLTISPESDISQNERNETYNFLVGILNIRQELLKYGIRSTDYTNIGNLGYKNGVLKYFDVGGFGKVNQPNVGDANTIMLQEEKESLFFDRSMANKIAGHVSEKYGYGSPRYFGEGIHGYAYDIGNDKIMKVTSDKSEAVESLKIKGKTMKRLADVYEVYYITPKPDSKILESYVIIVEKLKINEPYFDKMVERLSYAFEKILGLDFNNILDDYIMGGYDENKEMIDRYMSKNPEDSKFYYGLLAIADEARQYGIESMDYINASNLGYKKDGELGFFDMGYGDYKSEPKQQPQRVEMEEDGSSRYSSDHTVGQDDFPPYNQYDSSRSLENNLYANTGMYEDLEYNHASDATKDEYIISERILSSMPGSSTVDVKKKCRLGGLGNTSAACNQGDIGNLDIKPLKENEEVNVDLSANAEGSGWRSHKIMNDGQEIGEMELTYRKNQYLTLNRIFIKEEYRGRGFADKAMKLLIDYADRGNKTLTLTPDNVWGANKEKLKRWYQSYGFVINKGRNADYQTSEMMYRLPKTLTEARTDFNSESDFMKKLNYGVDKDEMVYVRSFPLNMLTVSKRGITGAIQDIRQGRPSTTNKPVLVFYNIDNKTFLVEDGYHRVAQAYLDKVKAIPVKIYSNTWSDYVANVYPEDRFNLNEGETICKEVKTTPEIDEFLMKFDSDETLLRSGGIPTDLLDKAAFGFDDTLDQIMPDKLSVKWHDDLENVKYYIKKKGLTDAEYARKVDLSESIDVSFDGKKFYIEDGHHRYYAAKILNSPLKMNLEIKANPIQVLGPGMGYDDFHRCIWKQVHNQGGKVMNEAMLMSLQDLPFKKEIEQMGGKIHSVGGAVRDEFLGKESKDLDVLITGVPMNKLEQVLSKYGRVDAVGKSFGVLKFKPRGATEDIDIAIPRTEKLVLNLLDPSMGVHKAFDVTYDHGLPIEKDLERRDFTINAIAKDSEGNIIDPYHGQEDLKNKIIRAVNPEAFSDDPLRMLRAVQFASRFGFTIEPKTMQMIINSVDTIKGIPAERILMEFDKIIKKGNKRIGVQLLKDTGLYNRIFGFDLKQSTIDRSPFEEVQTMGEFIYLLTRMIPNPAEFYLQKFASEDAKRDSNYKEIKALELAFESAEAVSLTEARSIAHNMYVISQQSLQSKILPDVIETAAQELLRGDYPKTVAELAVNGNDLMEMGYKGKQIGDALKTMLLKVYSGKVRNDKQELLSSLQSNINEEVKKKPLEKVEYGALMLFLDVPVWSKITSVIKKEDVFDKPGFGIENEPHLTILYGFHDEVTADEVFELYKKTVDLKPVEVRIKGISIFKNPDFDVVKFDVDSKTLTELNTVMRQLPNTTNFPEYRAHITLAYVNKGEGDKYVRPFEKERVIIGNKLVFSTKKGDKKTLMLTEKGLLKESESLEYGEVENGKYQVNDEIVGVNFFVKKYDEWNNQGGNPGYPDPSNGSVLEFFQNNYEDFSHNEKLKKKLLQALTDRDVLNESKSKSDYTLTKESLLKSKAISKEMKEEILKYLGGGSTYHEGGHIHGLIKPESLTVKSPKAEGVSMGADRKGFFVYTHRARSKSRPTPDKITVKEINFIESTG